MGQINCRCEEITIDDDFKLTPLHHHRKYSLPTLEGTDSIQTKHILTRITLKNIKITQYICLKENEQLVVGTSQECDHKWTNPSGNSFAMTMKMTQRSLMIRDLGVGLGVFVGRKKVQIKPNNEEHLLSLGDHFLVVKISEKKIFWTMVHQDAEYSDESPVTADINIKIKDIRVNLHQDSSTQEYTLRRQDRKIVFLLLGSEQRVKINEVLRLGLEYFTVDGIFTCIS